MGIIPNDWNIKSFSDLTDLIIDGTHHTPKYTSYGIPFLRVTDIQTDEIDLNGLKYVSHQEHKILKMRCFPQKGDILLSKNGTIGIPKIVDWDWEFSIFVSLALIKIKQNLLNINFLEQFLKSDFVKKQISQGSKQGTVTNLHLEEIRKFIIPLPPTKDEQTAIANVLNDADELITRLEKLIAKKRNIKQGAMQELLKPKDNWEVKRLADISYMKGRIGWQGLKQSEFTMNPDEPFLITGMNFKDGEIRWDEVYHVPESRYQIAKDIQLKINDVLITKDGTIGKLLYVRNIPYPHKATLNSHLLVFRPIANSYDPLYLYYNLSFDHFKNHVELYKSGTTFFGISQESISKYQIPLPPTKDEQTRIAQILSDMDTEIEGLERKLEKYKMLKQGMMQNLLTGKIRLI
jgi:type I restriction enzyme S subunit